MDDFEIVRKASRMFEDAANAWMARAIAAEKENERMLKALIAIRDGTISGKVGGDDVVWFDEITTLHDFCDEIIAKAIRPMTTADREP